MSLFTKMFGTRSERQVKKLMPLVEKTEALSEKYEKMSELKNKKNDTERLELKKYCPFCRKHTVHKETK